MPILIYYCLLGCRYRVNTPYNLQWSLAFLLKHQEILMFDKLRMQIEDKKVDADNDKDVGNGDGNEDNTDADNNDNNQINYNYHNNNNCHNKRDINEAEPDLKSQKKESIDTRSGLKNI